MDRLENTKLKNENRLLRKLVSIEEQRADYLGKSVITLSIVIAVLFLVLIN